MVVVYCSSQSIPFWYQFICSILLCKLLRLPPALVSTCTPLVIVLSVSTFIWKIIKDFMFVGAIHGPTNGSCHYHSRISMSAFARWLVLSSNNVQSRKAWTQKLSINILQVPESTIDEPANLVLFYYFHFAIASLLPALCPFWWREKLALISVK